MKSYQGKVLAFIASRSLQCCQLFFEAKYIIFAFFWNTFGIFYFWKEAKSNSAFLANYIFIPIRQI